MKKLLLFAISLSFLFSSCSKEDLTEPNVTPPQPVSSTSSPEVITLESGVQVVKKGDKYLWEGDILLSDTQLKALNDYGTIFPQTDEKPGPVTNLNPVTNLPLEGVKTTKSLGIYPTSYNMWAMVRFTYNSNLSSYQRESIKDALLDIESKTNVRFYNATGQPTVDPTYGFEYPYLDFTYVTGDISESYVGRIGGRQQVSLTWLAMVPWDLHIMEHEIMHACGMLHEMCRPDRDNYIVVNTSNLTSEGLAQFTKRTTNYYYIGNYDFESIMGYDSSTGSTELVYDTSIPMYTKKSDESEISQGLVMTDLDRRWTNSLYLPYIARSDVYQELDDVVYKSDNTIMTESERLALQAELNNGNPIPPAGGRIPNDF